VSARMRPLILLSPAASYDQQTRSPFACIADKTQGYLVTAPPWILRMCCLRWSGRQKNLPQRVQVKVYRDPRRPHSYLECRVRDDRDLYPRPHITHRNRSSPPPPIERNSVAVLAASIQGGPFYTSYRFRLHPGTRETNSPSAVILLASQAIRIALTIVTRTYTHREIDRSRRQGQCDFFAISYNIAFDRRHDWSIFLSLSILHPSLSLSLSLWILCSKYLSDKTWNVSIET